MASNPVTTTSGGFPTTTLNDDISGATALVAPSTQTYDFNARIVTDTGTATAPGPLMNTETLGAATGARPRTPTDHPTVGWIYDLRKNDLKREMAKYQLPTDGGSQTLRQRFVNFWRQASSPLGDHASQLAFNPQRPVSLHIPRERIPIIPNPDHSDTVDESIRKLTGELTSIREILQLSPNADTNTVKRALTAVVEATADTPPLRTRDLRGGPIYSWPDNEVRVTFSEDRPRPSSHHDGRNFPRPEANNHVVRRREPEERADATSICDLVRKWNLKFDGRREPISFIERLDELMDAYGVNGIEILKALPELLRDHALLWYRNGKDSWHDYDGFRNHFKRSFFPPGYAQSLEEELRKRTQGENEPFREFVVALSTLARRNGNFSRYRLLELLYANMRPEYKIMVCWNDFTTLDELIDKAENYEAYVRARNSFRPPPTPAVALVPELAYTPRNRIDRRPYHTSIVETTDNLELAPRRRRDQPQPLSPRSDRPTDEQIHSPPEPFRRNLVCWNCDGPGHLFRDCQLPKVLRCFYCKKRGIATNACRCRAGNEQPSQMFRGRPGSESLQQEQPLKNCGDTPNN